MRSPSTMRAPTFKAALSRALVMLCTLAVCGGNASTSHAQKRAALIVGNERYENISLAPKAEADARAVAASLTGLGFRPVMLQFGLDRSAMARAIDAFASSIEPGDLAVFYFAGNGAAINSQNLLLPIDVPPARTREENRAADAAFALDDIIATLRKRGANVVSIIDASRDNPFDRPGVQRLETGTGLVPMSRAQPMTYTLFSASPNEEARARIDTKDSDPNSVFGRILLSQLSETDISIGELALNVQRKVRDLARGNNFRQTPVSYESGIANLYLSGRSAPKYPNNFKVKFKPDGGKRFRLSEAEAVQNELPGGTECENLGQRFGDQLRREGGDSVRFWVRIRPGDIGYCQRVQNRWYVEYYDRAIQDGLVLDLRR